ncbi:hemA [Symbiodinium natans]|uniref:HemA protein n=1 Tax=Symbiodinium natans TaxID=878477 RepID=A0A812TJF3_9DINO|nr:hemA [Symbiodinium natans]
MSQDPAWSLLAAGMLSPLQQTWLAQKLAQTQTMPVAASSTLDAQTVYLQALQQLETERLLRAHADASHSVGAPTTQTEAEKAEAATPATANTSGDKKTEPDQKTPLQMEEEDLTRKRKQMAEKDDEYVRQYQNVQRDQQERSTPADTKPAVDPDFRKNSHAHMARRVGKFRLEHGTLEIFAKFVPNEVEPSGIAETKKATGSRPPVLLIPQTKKMPSPPTRQTSKVPVPPPGPPPAHVLRQEANTEEDVEVQEAQKDIKRITDFAEEGTMKIKKEAHTPSPRKRGREKKTRQKEQCTPRRLFVTPKTKGKEVNSDAEGSDQDAGTQSDDDEDGDVLGGKFKPTLTPQSSARRRRRKTASTKKKAKRPKKQDLSRDDDDPPSAQEASEPDPEHAAETTQPPGFQDSSNQQRAEEAYASELDTLRGKLGDDLLSVLPGSASKTLVFAHSARNDLLCMMRILVSEDILTLSDALENLADMEPGDISSMLGADAQKWFYDLTIKGKKLFLAWPLAVKEYCVRRLLLNLAHHAQDS